MPANTAEYQRQYMASYRAAGRDRTLVKPPKPKACFVGCDGEGATLPIGYHAYFMLTIGKEILRPLPGMVRLSTWQCLDFISRQDPSNIYVGYFFDYDVTKILEDLSFRQLHRLMHRELRTGHKGALFPVDYAEFQVDYLPHKEFKVRRKLEQTEAETKWSPWVVINDVGSFFQTSFLKAIQAWNVGTPMEWSIIDTGKQKRATFEVEDFQDIASYNALEIVLLESLMSRFRAACESAGVVPSRWQGPGLLAECMLKTHKVHRTSDIRLFREVPELVTFATNSYYGGHSEISVVGPINVPVFQWDINSAYPYAMQFVPCLVHGGWEYFDNESHGKPLAFPSGKPTMDIGNKFALCFGSFKGRSANDRSLWYGLPVRSPSGTIIYPRDGRGWYWSFEIESAVHQEFSTEAMWMYTRKCKCAPLAFVRKIYAERQRIGKDGPGIVLKLGMNSLYGKTVQSIGRPKYANPVWGSFITAYPRMMLNEFIHSSPICAAGQCGSDIFMCATDSITTSTVRTDYTPSKELGGWSVDTHEDGMFMVQPGVYFGSAKDKDGKKKSPKTRGVPPNFVNTFEPVFRDAFGTMVETKEMEDGDVVVPQVLFAGIRYALHRRNLKLLGQWIEFGEDEKKGKVISFDWSGKRALWPALAPTVERPWIQTFPYEGSTTIETIPYSKDIGGLQVREEMRLAFADQPDWSGGAIFDE